MGLTEKQSIPKQKEEKEGWHRRLLLPSLTPIAKSMARVFTNPFEWLLLYCVFVIGIAELTTKGVSWMFYAIAVLILAAAVFERYLADSTKLTDD